MDLTDQTVMRALADLREAAVENRRMVDLLQRMADDQVRVVDALSDLVSDQAAKANLLRVVR